MEDGLTVFRKNDRLIYNKMFPNSDEFGDS